MAKLFFHLRNVPEDEAYDVRAILEQHEIAFYETSAGNWGISTPAIWLYDEEDEYQARELIDAYQRQRAIHQRALYEEARNSGHHNGFWQHNLRHPVRFIAYITSLVLIVYVSVEWVLNLMH